MKSSHLTKALQGLLLAGLAVLLPLSAMAQTDTLAIYGTAIDPAKVYDGTDSARIITLGELPPLTHGTRVSLSGEAHYADAAAGLHKAVTVTFAISGADAANYIAPAPLTLYADIMPRRLVAAGTVIKAGKIYDGTTICEVIDHGQIDTILEGDTVWQTVTAEYTTPDFAYMKPVVVTHTLYGPQTANYYVEDNQYYTASIVKRPVVPAGISLVKVKEYDGTDTARILANPSISPLFGNDEVYCIATANYDSPEPGHGKSITGHFALTGSEADNYSIVSDSIIASDGAIIMPTELSPSNDGGDPIEAAAYGFCQGEQVRLRYLISQGEPTSYSIIHPESSHDLGFNDIIDIPCTPDDTVASFPLPEGCPAGRYPVEIRFSNEAGSTLSVAADFRVNLPNSYLVQVFDDVISIDNRSGQFNSYHWIHNGEFIDDTKPYHQELGGLTGSYAVLTNIATADEAMVCPLMFYNPQTTHPVVDVMPSPVIDAATIKLQCFPDEHHRMGIFNSHGTMVYAAVFDGNAFQLDMSALPHDTYIITVDGISAKTIKL